jgi:hypothetical protein
MGPSSSIGAVTPFSRNPAVKSLCRTPIRDGGFPVSVRDRGTAALTFGDQPRSRAIFVLAPACPRA